MNLPQDIQTINFGKDGCDNCQWYVVLDGVMGGRSNGSIEVIQKSIVFKGAISLANNGGFASFRSEYGQYDLSQFDEVEIRYRSTGQDFAFTLNKYRRFYRPNFKADLPVTDGQWITKRLSWDRFKRYRLGNRLSGALVTDDLEKIIRMGFISNQKKASPFSFEVDYIRFQ